MLIPENYHEMILNEFREVEKTCHEVNSIEDKLYFFSASFGILNRIMNFHCDPILVSMHQALQSVHQGLTQRLAAPKVPGNISTDLPKKMIEALFTYFSELIAVVEINNDNEIRRVIEKFIVLWYSTSGNGYYLYLRGKLEL